MAAAPRHNSLRAANATGGEAIGLPENSRPVATPHSATTASGGTSAKGKHTPDILGHARVQRCHSNQRSIRKGIPHGGLHSTTQRCHGVRPGFKAEAAGKRHPASGPEGA
ncbi:MAG: hypothetical protein LBG65_06900 [Puniceicoccales bacterium]|nr:hypothetical protein [Puniceicoccales bacterium]